MARIWRIVGAVAGLSVATVLALAVADELRTSTLQSAFWRGLLRDARFTVAPGASDATRFPADGPYDERLGYTRLPTMIERLQGAGYTVTDQARISPALAELHDHGLSMPYREKNQAGLTISDCRREPLLQARVPARIYRRFEDVPPLLVDALLFIEDRHLLDPDRPQRNPAFDPRRSGKAVIEHLLRAVDAERSASGGSTLATQIEKYRHSPGGRTLSFGDKVRQMASASLRAYADGDDTLPRRRQIVVDYLNTVPLAARAGFGEVHGLGDGLWAWYGRDFAEFNRLLVDSDEGTSTTGAARHRQAEALKQALSLMVAQRRPAHYLLDGADDLRQLTDSYLRLLADAGIIRPALRDAALAAPLRIPPLTVAPRPDFVERKAIHAMRSDISTLVGVPRAYDLERFDLEAESSLDRRAQAIATRVLGELRRPEAAAAAGLYGLHLLSPGADPAPIVYSFTLFERGRDANYLRVQTDNVDQPFDVNEGARLDMGSTAKLRTLVSYLELVAELHGRWSTLEPASLAALPVSAQDPLGRWVRDQLRQTADRSLASLLEAAMLRRYSASQNEAFFTGGGLHRFENFEGDRNDAIPVSEAFTHSVNLVFIRMMRDIVRHRMYGGSSQAEQILQDRSDPARRAYLVRFAEREGATFLARFHPKYAGKPAAEAAALLLRGARSSTAGLTSALLTIEPDASDARLDALLEGRLGRPAASDEARQALRSRHAALSLADRGHVAGIHPLELWLVGYLRDHPGASLTAALAASHEARRDSYEWLFATRHKSAQDRRIQELMELDAFELVHRSWHRLGYPFDSITPSYAASIGAAGDRPAALAELMGILVNDGARLPLQRVEALHFARHTPYEARLEHRGQAEQLLAPEVAAAVRRALVSVVNDGTARRLKGALLGADGQALEVGGKTGTGDHREVATDRSGRVVAERTISRSATLVFTIGDRYFGTLMAYVAEPDAARYRFTSSLPTQLLKALGAELLPALREPGCTSGSP